MPLFSDMESFAAKLIRYVKVAANRVGGGGSAKFASAQVAHSQTSDLDLGLRHLVEQFTSREDIARLLPHAATGIELGVAFGGFASRLLDQHPSLFLYGVDMYAGDRHHTTEQYCDALRRLLPHERRSKLLRMRFDEAVTVFPDAYFDFIYVDGYAHNGQEDGETLRQWYPKLKAGGVFSGDDYSSDWPRTMAEVDRFAVKMRLPIYVMSKCADAGRQEYPSWLLIKPGRPGYLEQAVQNALLGDAVS